MIKRFLAESWVFIRENPAILASLVLMLLIPIAIFVNARVIISAFEKDIDVITQSKAVLVEDVLGNLLSREIRGSEGPEILNVLDQSFARNLVEAHSEILLFSVAEPLSSGSSFRTIVSSDESLIGQESDDTALLLAWNRPEGIAFLGYESGQRYWSVTRSIANADGQKTALVTMRFSLQNTDELMNRTLNISTWVLGGTILIVVLLVINQARLFRYVFLAGHLREIDKMKDTFVSMASHELRSPLTAIKGNIEFLVEKQQQSGADEESKHYTANIASSVNRLEALVNDMLEVSRLEGNRIPIHPQKIAIGPILGDSIEEMRAQAMHKNLELTYTPCSECFALTDPDRLKQIVINLIGNAIKYTEKGGVKVSSKIKNREILITVADTGIGISAEDQKKLFQKFSRIQNEKTKNIIGTGLGLWITFELVKKMNGSVSVESIEGVGSHFTVHLPRAI